MKRTLINASMLAIVLGLVSGCVTTQQLDEVRSMAQGAQSTANSAARSADNAMSAANAAMDAAKSASDCCNENSSKLDRMFEKAMAK